MILRSAPRWDVRGYDMTDAHPSLRTRPYLCSLRPSFAF